MAPGVGNQVLRIVLFGRPGSGKSSLLGALALAAETAGDVRSWLMDLDGRLAELKRRVRDNQPQPTITPEQAVPYPVLFERFLGKKDRTEALLLDCDGNAALHLLTAERFPDPEADHNQLAQEIARADALVLLIPASGPGSAGPALDEELAEFERFLQQLEAARGSAVQAGGLPVAVALTKSDLLVRPGQTLEDWGRQLEEQRQRVDQRLQRLHSNGSRSLLFGQVDVLPARPTALHGPEAGARGPVGVVELFRQSLERARAYRRSQGRSTRRLLTTVLALVLLLAGMLVFGIFRGGFKTPVERNALQAAIDFEVSRYQKLRERATFLESFAGFRALGDAPVSWTTWHRQVEELQSQARLPPPSEEERLPGTQTLTYAAVYKTRAVRQARVEWQEVEDKLKRRLELVRAFGLVPPGPKRTALLKVPPPPDFTVAQASGLLDRLNVQYPHWQEWGLVGLPGAVNRELKAAIESSRRNLLQAGRDTVLAELQLASSDGKESVVHWKKVHDWLAADPEELAAWRTLILFVARLADPLAADPVEELADFLGLPQFDTELRRIVLRLPDSLKLAPGKSMTVYHVAGADAAALPFKLWGTPWRDEISKETRFTFVPDSEETLTYRLTYRPGEAFWAELPVQAGDKQDRLFTWSVCRSQLYQFERLTRSAPRLHGKDQPVTQGQLAEGAELLVEVLPTMPELLPVVKLKRRLN